MMVGQYDDYIDIDPSFDSTPDTSKETPRRKRQRQERDATMAASGLQPTYFIRCDIDDGGEAETMEQVQAAMEAVPDRGTLPPPLVSNRANEITPEMRERFLSNYAQTGIWNQSSYDVGCSGAAMKRLASEDPGFSLMVAEAVQDFRELIQAEIIRRGVRGVVEPVFGRGGKDCPDQIVGYVRKFSDRLLELEARAAWPKRYRENVESLDGRRYGVLVVPGMASPEEWQIEARKALQRPTPRRKVTRPVD